MPTGEIFEVLPTEKFDPSTMANYQPHDVDGRLVFVPQRTEEEPLSADELAEEQDPFVPPVIIITEPAVASRRDIRRDTGANANKGNGKKWFWGVAAGAAIVAAVVAGKSGNGTSNEQDKPIQAPAYTGQTLKQETDELTRDKADAIRVAIHEKVVAHERWLAEMLKLPNPAEFEDAQALGAISITYKDTALNLAQDKPIADYYANVLSKPRPAINNPFVHRLVADSSNADKVLAEGAVMEKGGTPNNLIIAMHDITPVVAPVTLDGKTYNQSEMGKNAVPVVGDLLTLAVNRNGYVVKFEYELTDTKVVPATDAAAAELYLNSGDTPEVKTYMCWEPGSADKRFVGTWRLVDKTLKEGEVVPVGGPGSILGPSH